MGTRGIRLELMRVQGMPKRIDQNPQGRKVKISIGMLGANLTTNGEQNELHLS
jgi:hypothetical protein